MKLSILTLCCDKDWMCVNTLLDNIATVYKETNVSFDDYEVILVDNRTVYVNEPTNWHEYSNVTVLLANSTTMYKCRRQAFYKATGDYIWVVDGDDLIVKIPEIDEDTDIIGFKYYRGSSEEHTAINTILSEEDITLYDGLSYKHISFSKTGFLSQAHVYIMSSAVMLWCKLFKADLLKKVYSILPEDIDINATEDLLVWTCTLALANSISYYDIGCYFYNCSRSLNHNSTFTLLNYSRMIQGVDTSLNLLYNLSQQGIIRCSDKWINVVARNHCYVFAGKLLLVKDPDERAEAAKLLLNIFDSRTIETSILRYYLNMGISDRRTMIRTLLELDRLLSEGAPMEPSLDYLIKELGYGN